MAKSSEYNLVRCNYNDGNGFWTVDAWETSNPNEEGKVVAVIEENTGNVYFIHSVACNSEKVKNAIKERVSKIFAEKQEKIFNSMS